MNKSRSGNVDIARFIGAIMIMLHHLFNFEICTKYGLWSSCIYVEFFLIITGYYTTKHFDGMNSKNSMKSSISYTLNKFIKYLPYVILANLIGYTIYIFSYHETVKEAIYYVMNNFIFDIFLISEPMNPPYLFSLWYLSAMFIVFPLFARFIQIKNRYYIMAVSFVFPLIYYGKYLIPTTWSTSIALLRVLAGLCLGSFVYELTYAFKEQLEKINKIFLTLIECIAFLFVIVVSKEIYSIRLDLFCFVVCLAIMLPNLSYTSKIKGKLFTYLGRLSMPMYIFHWAVAGVITFHRKYHRFSDNKELLLYFGGTIILSIIFMYIVDHCKWIQKIINKPITLRD